MEGKGVSRSVIIMGLLILGLVVPKTATAYNLTCKTKLAQELYNYCVSYTGTSIKDCAKAAGCTLIESSHPHSNMLDSGAMIIEYCKLGCVSSVCDTVTTNKNSGEVSEAMERCVNGCSELCNKGAKTVLASA